MDDSKLTKEELRMLVRGCTDELVSVATWLVTHGVGRVQENEFDLLERQIDRLQTCLRRVEHWKRLLKESK